MPGVGWVDLEDMRRVESMLVMDDTTWLIMVDMVLNTEQLRGMAALLRLRQVIENVSGAKMLGHHCVIGSDEGYSGPKLLTGVGHNLNPNCLLAYWHKVKVDSKLEYKLGVDEYFKGRVSLKPGKPFKLQDDDVVMGMPSEAPRRFNTRLDAPVNEAAGIDWTEFFVVD